MIKSKIFLLLVASLLAYGLSAQTIQNVSGSFCVGSGSTFILNGTSCSSFSWSISSGVKGVDYDYSTNTSSSFNISWLKPMNNFYITCSYASCTGSGGTTYSSPLTISNNAPQFTVGGGGSYCAGGNGFDVTLSGSQSGITYQLKIDGVNSGAAIAGTGSPLTWVNQKVNGYYTVTSSACPQDMSGGVSVTVNPLPTQFTVSGGGSYCVGGSGVNVTLSGSQMGVNYQLSVNGNSTTKAGTGGALTWPNQTAIGTYTVTGTYAATGCSQPMRGSANVSITNVLPAIFGVSGGGCCNPISVTLNGSQSGVSYQLLINGNNAPISALAGTGTSLNWNNLNVQGTYTVSATSVETGCNQVMGGYATMNLAYPVANAGADKTINLPTTSLILNGSGSDLGGAVASYQWTKISGLEATLGNLNAADLSLSGLVFGSYVFQLVVTDNLGERSTPDQVTVTVVYNYNWMRETTLLVENKLTEADVEGALIQTGQKNINWAYFDGLGRPIQSTSVQGSPLGKDIVQPIAYDKFGRENKKYLPYVSSATDGRLEVDALKNPASSASLDELARYKTGAHYQFYQSGGMIATDQAPYAETVFEPSPLNKVIKQGASGLPWQPDPANLSDRTIKRSNEINAANEISYFTYDSSIGLIINGYYEAGQLYASKTKDEHNNEVIEYADKEGHTICKKVQYGLDASSSKILYASTYYIYNDFGNLVVVLPPEATKTLLQE